MKIKIKMYKKKKSLITDSKVKFRQASIERVLEAAKLAFANKTKHILHFNKA